MMDIKLRKKLEHSNIGKRYWECDLEKVDHDSTHYNVTKSYLEDLEGNLSKGRGITYVGDYGRGKTALSVCVAKEVLKVGGTVLFLPVKNLQEMHFKQDARFGGMPLYDRARFVDLLILDDVGSQDPSEFILSKLEKMIRDRYDNMKSIIVSVNSEKLFKQNFNAGAIGIFTEINNGVIVKGVDWRKKIFQENKKSS